LYRIRIKELGPDPEKDLKNKSAIYVETRSDNSIDIKTVQ